MSDNPSSGNKAPSDNISDQLNELGKNLRAALQSVWESEERRKLQKEIEDGMANLGESLSQAAREFSESPTGKSIKEDVKDFQERWKTGEVGTKARSEIVDALRRVNEELQKAVGKNPPKPPENPGA